MITNTRWWTVAILFLLLVSAQANAQDTLWRKYMEEGTYAYHEGRYAEAEKSWRTAVKEAEEGFGPEDQRVFLSLNKLAGLYYAQGKYTEAEPLAKRSVMIVEKIMGAEHPYVAGSLNNLGEIYRLQRKYAEAEPLYKRAVAIWEKALGREHPQVALGLENYAALLLKTNRDAEAAKMESRAKAIRAKHASPEVVAFKNYVNDYVGVVSDKTEHDLNALLKNLERKSGAQIAVVVIDSTGGTSGKDYAVQFGSTWGVGQKGKNHGVVFLVAVEDRNMFIATSTGLEKSILPNDKVADIRDRDILPHFRKGDIAGGIVNGTLRLAQEISEAEGIRLKP